MRRYDRPVTLFSRDEALVGRLQPLLEVLVDLRLVSDYPGFRGLMDQLGPSIVLLDVRLPEGSDSLADIAADLPHHVLIALGTSRSDPMRSSAIQLMFAAEDLSVEPDVLFRLIRQAQSFLEVAEECRILRREKADGARALPRSADPDPASGSLSLKEFSRIIRCLDNVDELQERLLEELATSMQLSRAGIVMRPGPGLAYEVRAGWMLLEEARRASYEDSEPFVRWLERHAHVVSRATLGAVEPLRDQIMLRRVLDRLGAEILLPLRGRSGLLGWLFAGHPVSGQPIDPRMLDQLITVADVMSVSLESALLYKEVSLQKTLAESLLEALPTGIVYADTEGQIRWFSTEAACILDVPQRQAVGKPLDVLGSRLAALGRDTMIGERDGDVTEWKDALTGRPLRVTTSRLVQDHTCLGVLMMIQDRTQQVAFEEKEERLERNVFWTELAASMSHEVRNPLVAIKTFAQLLPDRYNDPEFRDQFSQMVVHEVDRLNAMIDQINSFAHPPDLRMAPLDIREPLKQAVTQLNQQMDGTGSAPVEEFLADHLPLVRGDTTALAECLGHVLSNAMEILQEQKGGKIRITVEPLPSQQGERGVMIRISDNGKGMDSEIYAKAFSPFCTTKARGMGLGLSIAQRTIADHNGRMELATSPYGTTVTIFLPAAEKGDMA